jgi:hypothetical protein
LLRIHTEKDGARITLRLEGKLVDPWGDELVKAYMALTRCRLDGQEVGIDLEAVSFVDPRGRSILTALRRLGCTLRGSGPFIEAVIDEITAEPLA